jgi:thioredoxin-related protein
MGMQKHCGSKKSIRTKREAEEVARNMSKKYFIFFKAYRCSFCGKFHVGRFHKRRKAM